MAACNKERWDKKKKKKVSEGSSRVFGPEISLVACRLALPKRLRVWTTRERERDEKMNVVS